MKTESARRIAESWYKDEPAPGRSVLVQLLLEALDRVDELQARPTNPRPMSEAPRDGTLINLVCRARFHELAWRGIPDYLSFIDSDAIGWLPTSSGGGES